MLFLQLLMVSQSNSIARERAPCTLVPKGDRRKVVHVFGEAVGSLRQLD